mgnify:CR=1 FL=1
MTKIGFIGAGMMAEAIISGMLKSGFAPEDIWGSNRRQERRHYMNKTYGIRTVEQNTEILKNCDPVVIAVKPQYFPAIQAELENCEKKNLRVISIMAGISIRRLQEVLRPDARVLRAMPNTPAMIGEGVTALCADEKVEAVDLELAKKIFSSIGKVYEIEERLIDAFAGVAGCGPAYAYMMIQALADGGVRMGLPRQLAQDLAAEMLRGSAGMVLAGKGHPEELKDKVCSPGGTTIEGVYALEKAGFRAALMEAVQVSTEKSARL